MDETFLIVAVLVVGVLGSFLIFSPYASVLWENFGKLQRIEQRGKGLEMNLYTVVVFEGGIGDDSIPPPMFFVADSDHEFVTKCMDWAWMYSGQSPKPLDLEPEDIDEQGLENLRRAMFVQRAIDRGGFSTDDAASHNIAWKVQKITYEQGVLLKAFGILANDWNPYLMAQEYGQ